MVSVALEEKLGGRYHKSRPFQNVPRSYRLEKRRDSRLFRSIRRGAGFQQRRRDCGFSVLLVQAECVRSDDCYDEVLLIQVISTWARAWELSAVRARERGQRRHDPTRRIGQLLVQAPWRAISWPAQPVTAAAIIASPGDFHPEPRLEKPNQRLCATTTQCLDSASRLSA